MTYEQENSPAMIGAECFVKGEMLLRQDAVIHGCVEGVLKVTGKLTLTETSRVTGIVIADEVQLSGQAEGNVIATDLIELHTGATISGRLFTGRLIMGEGVVLQAETNVGPDAMATARQVVEKFESEQVVFKSRDAGKMQQRNAGGVGIEAVQGMESRQPGMEGGIEQGNVVTDSQTVSSILQKMRPLTVDTGSK